MLKTHFQHGFCANVWCGIINDQVIGPFILDNQLTERTYLEYLQSTLPALLDDVPLATQAGMYIQHDAAPPHVSRVVIQT
jgi:hypothetical protein